MRIRKEKKKSKQKSQTKQTDKFNDIIWIGVTIILRCCFFINVSFSQMPYMYYMRISIYIWLVISSLFFMVMNMRLQASKFKERQKLKWNAFLTLVKYVFLINGLKAENGVSIARIIFFFFGPREQCGWFCGQKYFFES